MPLHSSVDVAEKRLHAVDVAAAADAAAVVVPDAVVAAGVDVAAADGNAAVVQMHFDLLAWRAGGKQCWACC